MTATSPSNDAAVWLACGQQHVLRGDYAAARASFAQGLAAFPDAAELCLALAGIDWQLGHAEAAESRLRELLAHQPEHAGATFLLVRILAAQGRLQAAALTMRDLFAAAPQDTDTLIQAVELLDGLQRVEDAAALCDAALATGNDDPRLHAYAGMLGIQLGRFDDVREHYAHALAHSAQAVEWNIPLGLAGLQRYEDANHPDFAFFHTVLQRPALSEQARMQTLFALGKAHDDLGDYATAADWLRQANALAHARSTWSRKRWRRAIEARLAAAPPPVQLEAPADWAPLFIVGVPRSGTTLLAARLARHSAIRHRGELGWLANVARQLEPSGMADRAALEHAAAIYAAQLRQDDAPARWYLDKQPLNLLHVDLILALWPNARILHCQRDARDVALSLWSQSFRDPAHDYAYDFADIAALLQGCERLATHWRKRYPHAIRTVRYETLVAEPALSLRELAQWLELPDADVDAGADATRIISTASAWQARQATYTRSIGRWRAYAPHLPELLQLPTP